MSVPAPTSAVRVGCVQYDLRPVASFDDFARNVAYFVEVAAEYRGDFVVFPELFTLQLLSMAPRRLDAPAAIDALTAHTGPLTELLGSLAVRHGVNIIGGSHPMREGDGRVVNTCFVALRDGSLHRQDKIHPTPNERGFWGISGGDRAQAILTDRGPVGVMICYDAEFPELGRHLTYQGARLLFVPFCTDDRTGYLRVRYCAQARAVENQVHLALAGNVGCVRGVANMDIQYAQSCILTPCDLPFARDGIAAEATPGIETVVVADLDLDALDRVRVQGTVRNLADRRTDLYGVDWRGSA